MEYHKLVRDRIPEIIQAKGESCVVRVAEPAEFDAKLKEKLREEVDEFIASGSPEEIADIYEVIDALLEGLNTEKAAVLALQEKKRVERGAFAKRIILESTNP